MPTTFDNARPIAETPRMGEKDAFEKLAGALRERLRVIADAELRTRDPAAQLHQLQAASEEIARLSASLPSPVDPRLAHFLERGSYDKALAWLESALSRA